MTARLLTSAQKTRAQLAPVDDLGLEVLTGLKGLRFDDIQEVQILQDKLHVLNQAFEMDMQIISQVKLRFASTMLVAIDGFVGVLDDLLSLATSERARVSSMIKRLDGTLALVRKR